MKIKFYTNLFRLTLSIYIACFLLGGCSKLGNRYGISPTVDNGPSNNIENPDRSLSDSTQKLFAAIKDSNIAEVKQLLENDFNDDAFMHLCQTNAYGNTCLHVAAGAEHLEKPLEAEKIMALLLDKMKPLLLTKEAFKNAVDQIDRLDRIYLDSTDSIKDSRERYQELSTFFYQDHSFMQEEDSFWSLGMYGIPDNKSKKDKLLNLLNKIQPQRCNTDSELMRKNNKGETPIYAAIHYGSSGVMKELLTYTHKLIGLDIAGQTGKPLPIIFQYLMDHDNGNKLQDLVNQYDSPLYDHKLDRYFPPDQCTACEIRKRIQDNHNNNFQQQDNGNRRIEAVLREVGITDSEISRFFASRIPFSPNALSASSSSSREHVGYKFRDYRR